MLFGESIHGLDHITAAAATHMGIANIGSSRSRSVRSTNSLELLMASSRIRAKSLHVVDRWRRLATRTRGRGLLTSAAAWSV